LLKKSMNSLRTFMIHCQWSSLFRALQDNVYNGELGAGAEGWALARDASSALLGRKCRERGAYRV
jgi:hypothetical protein